MGFRSVAIEKRSSEVWKVLGAAKAEFSKYGTFIEKVSKQLATAQNTLEDAGKRTRAVERKLRDVETLEAPEADALLAIPLGLEDDEETV
jgi:DNA recombination protein RmuC